MTRLSYKNEIYFTGNSQKQKLSFTIQIQSKQSLQKESDLTKFY